jgi:hypothetical protein
MPIILATGEAEIRRISVPETLSLDRILEKRGAGVVAQLIDRLQA